MLLDKTKELVAALEAAGKAAFQEINNAPRDDRAGWAHISQETTLPVAEALRSVPEVSALESFMYFLPYEGSVIDLGSVAIYLTFRAINTSAAALVHDLIRICSERKITLTHVRLVTDIAVDGIVNLGDGFFLVPPVGVPMTEHSDWIFSQRNRPAHGWGEPPSAAVICTRTIPLILHPKPKGVEDTPLVDVAFPPQSDWDAVMSALIVGSNGAPQFRQSFYVINDIGWLGMPNVSIGLSETFPVPGKPVSKIWTERLPNLFKYFRQINPVINLAIKQLESSRRRLSDVERAIDFGICVEALLMSGAKDNGEISYKIATRAAWLLGDTPEKRNEIYDVARALYNTRSAAAHTGSLKPARNMEEADAQFHLFQQFDNLCASLIATLAEKGFPGDWKKVVLDLPPT
jgi:hypothetical protein